MMNEVLSRRYVKRIMKLGVPKHMAKEIVETAMETSRERVELTEFYIGYALSLEYGLTFHRKLDA